VDMHLLTAIEAVNGGSELHGLSGIPFWDKELNQGCRLTGIGGSDNHRPMDPADHMSSIGMPTTVVYASELSTPAILDGIRAGHVFIDLEGTRDRLLEFTAGAEGAQAQAGDAIQAKNGAQVQLQLHVAHAAGGKIRWIEDGKEMPGGSSEEITSDDQRFSVMWTSDGHRHWFRAEVAGADGKLWLVGNPVYVNWDSENECAAH
jgi:hypothetical protein